MSKALKMIQAELEKSARKGKRRGRSDLPAKGRREENEYGLTFTEWLRATGMTPGFEGPGFSWDSMKMIRAWKRGEDPSDYRAGR